ncbi:efflux RND transporter periplasmic adaptor subunit [Melioribacteraceae bacterium 4301-Me]|uniref:efflux RND transporter periplasmic adaptor subunit n=1 Tax=Pyranulibacter aquaticus TaxID=3163344 RepID=UPI003595E3B7
MKKKYLIPIVSVIIVLIAGYLFLGGNSDKKVQFTFAEVTRGNLSTTITSTGTLEALSTVDVGTQVSGRIAKLFVDFNDEVKKGQLLALIDTTTLAANVRDAEANLEKAKAMYKESLAKHERNKKLYEKNFISELDFIQSQTDVESALASLKSAESALDRAKLNLGYAFITAPISGKIINRNVEAGQTVAASLSAPTLFTIAEDLSSMRILADVDESDIGQISVGQKVEFTVQAYPDKKFSGEVTQIRLSPKTVQNVVNYTVVISAPNQQKLLLPGMTATVDFYTAERDNVLLIPNAALRFQPTEEMLAEFRKEMEKQRANLPDSVKQRFQQFGGGQFSLGQSMDSAQRRNRNFGRVWYLDENGKLKMTFVVTGLTDGKNTEIVRSRNLKEGMKVITGMEGNDTNSISRNTNRSNPLGGGRFFIR